MNPSSTIILDGVCSAGCPDLTTVVYEYIVSYTLQANLTGNVVWQTLPNNDFVSGKGLKELHFIYLFKLELKKF